jgi:hypothetical protein
LIRGCVEYFETDTHICTHANYNADLPMNRQSPANLRWRHLGPNGDAFRSHPP